MTIVNDFQNGVSDALSFGQKIRIKYYNTSIGAGSYYDDDISYTVSGGDYWISGVLLPISQNRGNVDAMLIEQGKVLTNDSKLYIAGNVNTSGVIKIGISGANITGEYSVIAEGITEWDVNATSILKKLYIRKLPLGSFIGE